MSIGAEVASHLPFLRRYARALTGSQTTGDAFVRATLEAALADGELAESLREGRVPLYRAFNKVWSSADLMGRGQNVYSANCAACHQPNGRGVPNACPALAGAKVPNGPKEGHILVVLNGRQGTAMPSFRQLSDTDIAAVVTFTRQSWGNKGGDVQPAEVRAARNKS